MQRGILLILAFASLIRASGQTTIIPSNDTSICLGGTATLSAVVTGGSYGTNSYSFQIIPYDPMPFSGGISIDSTFAGGINCLSNNYDDCWGGPFSIGFNFCFFNQIYSQFYAGSNGWISFSQPLHSWTTYTPHPLPCDTAVCPKNCILAPYQDWYPHYNPPSPYNIFYYTTGTAPNRKCVIYWTDCPMYNCTNGPKPPHGTFQIVLNEQNSIIENNIQEKPACNSWQNNAATQGVQDSTGTVAFIVPGRNQSSWTASYESTRFVPSGITWYTGGYPGGTIVGYATPINFSPTVTTTYTAVVTECDETTATGDVTVTVINAAFNYPADNYCYNDTNPTPTVANPGGIFTATPAGLVFVSASTGTIDLGASTPGTYTVTYSITTPCSVSTSHDITIKASPETPVSVSSYISRCGPDTVTFGVIPAPGITIKWYDAPAGGNFLFTGSSITTNVTVTTHFYAEAISDTTSCSSLTRADILVKIKPIPVITNTILSYSICFGDSIKINLLSTMINSDFNWRAYSNSPTLTGYFNGSGSVIAQKPVNSGSIPDSLTYAVAAVADTCTGDTVRFVVIVLPSIIATATPSSQAICSNDSVTINLTSGLPNATFTWTVSSNSPDVTGYSDGSGSLISQSLTNSGAVNGMVTYKIVPHDFGCNGDTAVSTVTVRPNPDLSNTPKNKSICNNTGTSITLISTIPGTQFTWTASSGSPNISGYSNDSIPTVILNQILANSGFTLENVIYHITPHNNDCDGLVTDFTINVFPVPNILFVPSSQAICSGQQCNINLNSNVSGTTFSWTAHGSSPAIQGFSAGSGIQIRQTLQNSSNFPGTATYVVTSAANGCPGKTDSVIVTVNPVPLVTLAYCNDSVTATNAQPFKLKGGVPVGGIYSGPGVNPTTGIFNPAAAGAGNKTINYTYTNAALCSASAMIHIFNFQFSIFNCGNPLTDIRDNQTYQTVLIGSQCWLAENLNYGNEIPDNIVQRDNCVPERYRNPASSIQHPASVYQWDELMQYDDTPGQQGLCPPGWHVPTENDWQTLVAFNGGLGFAASVLLSTGFSGFNALVNGSRFENSSWNFSTLATHFWTSTAWGPVKAWAHAMNNMPDDHSVSTYPAARSNAFSVRCLKD